MWALAVFAAGAGRGDPLRQPEVIWGTVGLMFALLAGAAVIYVVDKWRKRTAEGARHSAGELTDYRGMYERGEITEDEYAKLRDKFAAKVKGPPAGSPWPRPPGALPGPDTPTPPPDPTNPANLPPPV